MLWRMNEGESVEHRAECWKAEHVRSGLARNPNRLETNFLKVNKPIVIRIWYARPQESDTTPYMKRKRSQTHKSLPPIIYEDVGTPNAFLPSFPQSLLIMCKDQLSGLLEGSDLANGLKNLFQAFAFYGFDPDLDFERHRRRTDERNWDLIFRVQTFFLILCWS